MKIPTSIRVFLRACAQWSANNDLRFGAALAYYALFSIAPLLVIAVTIAGAVFEEKAAQGQVEEHLKETVGPKAAEFIQDLVKNAAEPRAGTFASSLGIGLLVIGALSMFLHVRDALRTIWKLEPPRGHSLLGVLMNYVLALSMVLVCGVLLVASVAANMLVTIFQPTLERWMPGLDWQWVEVSISFLYLTLLFAAIYWILSGGLITWRYVLYGSFIAGVLFTLGKSVLGWYFVYTSPASAYGAAGTLVMFLIWIYYSSQVLFFGAELIQARRTRKEWMDPQPPPLAS
jgi:membrane protein